jgi:hypothetical protein
MHAGRDPLGFARGRLFDCVTASLSRNCYFAQDDREKAADDWPLM